MIQRDYELERAIIADGWNWTEKYYRDITTRPRDYMPHVILLLNSTTTMTHIQRTAWQYVIRICLQAIEARGERV